MRLGLIVSVSEGFPTYSNTNLSLHCGHVQLCDMSVSNPIVTPTHNGTTCINMVLLFCFFAEWVHVGVEGYC